MATKKMTKTEPIITEENKIETPVTVDADALIKSILNNVGNDNNSRSRRTVICRSVTNGGLNINCRSGNLYEFKDYGYDCEIDYDDLVVLARKRSEHLFLPRIIIEDEDFLNEFPQIRKAYENIYSKDDLDEIFELPVSRMMDVIKSMPSNVQYNLQSLIANKIADGSIDSVRTIRALSEYYNSDFNLLSELFSK